VLNVGDGPGHRRGCRDVAQGVWADHIEKSEPIMTKVSERKRRGTENAGKEKKRRFTSPTLSLNKINHFVLIAEKGLDVPVQKWGKGKGEKGLVNILFVSDFLTEYQDRGK